MKSKVVDCLVLPELPLFLKMNVDGNIPPLSTVMINRYLLVLILLWTKQDACLYHDSMGPKLRITLPGATKKSAVRDHIQSMTEKMAALREEAEQRQREAEQGRREAEEKQREAEEKQREAEEILETPQSKKMKK